MSNDKDMPFPPDYMEGFVKKCSDLNLNEDQTENLFHIHANNALLSDPDVYQGFREVISRFDGLKKSAMLKYLSPENLALAVDCQVRYGEDLWSQEMRKQAGLPEPSWDTVSEDVKTRAAFIYGMEKSNKKSAAFSPAPLEQFDALPLNQKILISSLFGGSLGALSRVLAPTTDDQNNQRGVVSRATRGIIRGGLTGAGAAAGETAGSAVGAPGGDESKFLGMTGGAMLGGIAGHGLAGI